MIANTKGVSLESKSPNEEINYTKTNIGGSHWVAIVFLPLNFRGLLGNLPDDDFSDDFQKIILFDSLPSHRNFPPAFTELIKSGFYHKYDASTNNPHQTEHHYPNVFDKDIWIIQKSNRRQQNLNSCGYWAIFNALMTVLTGNHEFYEKFSIESPLDSILTEDQRYNRLINADYFLMETINSLIHNSSITKNNNNREILNGPSTLKTTQRTSKKTPITEEEERGNIFNKETTKNSEKKLLKKDGTPDMRHKINRINRETEIKDSTQEREKTPNKRKAEENLTQLNYKSILENTMEKELPTTQINKQHLKGTTTPTNHDNHNSKDKKTSLDAPNFKETNPQPRNDQILNHKPSSVNKYVKEENHIDRAPNLHIIGDNEYNTPSKKVIKAPITEEHSSNNINVFNQKNMMEQTLNTHINDTILTNTISIMKNKTEENSSEISRLTAIIYNLENRVKNIEGSSCNQQSGNILDQTRVNEITKISKMIETKIEIINNYYKKIEHTVEGLEVKCENIKKSQEKTQEKLDKESQNWKACIEKMEIQFREINKIMERRVEKMEIENENNTHEDKLQKQLEKLSIKTNENILRESKYQEQIKKMEEKFSELTIEHKKDMDSYKIDFTKEKEALEKFKNTIKNASPNNLDTSYTILEKKISEIDRKIAENYNEIKNKVEEAQQTTNTLEGNLIGVTDEINTALLPLVIGINRRTQAITNRLDAYWKNRGYNRYHNEEQKGFGINTEIIRQELIKQHQDLKYKKFDLINMDSTSAEEEEELKLKVGTTLKGKENNNIKNSFRRNQGFYREKDEGIFEVWIPKNLEQDDTSSKDSNCESKNPSSQIKFGKYRTNNARNGARNTPRRNSNQ